MITYTKKAQETFTGRKAAVLGLNRIKPKAHLPNGVVWSQSIWILSTVSLSKIHDQWYEKLFLSKNSTPSILWNQVILH